ncbi:MAG: PHB depolymerase family esterase [Polyangiaceae bacterium]
MNRTRALLFTVSSLLAACSGGSNPGDGELGGSEVGPSAGGAPAEAGGAGPSGGGASPSAGGASPTTGGADAGGAPAATGGSGVGGSGGGGGETAAPACAGLSGAAGDFDKTVSIDGEERRYLLHVPASYDPTAPTPLIVALHGLTESPEDIRDKSHLDEVADERGFIVAYPEGKNASWNGGVCCGLARLMDVDDVGFIRVLLDAVEADYCVDPDHVHATGFSNGGFMTHRLACELADRIASVGVVAGQEGLPSCSPARPIAMLQIHGTADPLVPYGGNPILGYPSTESTVDGWADRDSCADDSAVVYEDDTTSCVLRAACAGGAAVELCTVDGGLHDWFGGGTLWTDAGPPAGFVATTTIVDFLMAHPR